MGKIKVYLDTNTVVDFFIYQAKAARTGELPIVPEKLKFFLENGDKIEFITSVATKAEIIRELVGGLGVDIEKIGKLWVKFMEELNCSYVKEIVLNERFSEMPQKYPMKLRTLVNFIHLFVAMKEDAYLLTGDKDLINIVRENKLYDRILSYVELREIVSSSSSPDL